MVAKEFEPYKQQESKGNRYERKKRNARVWKEADAAGD